MPSSEVQAAIGWAILVLVFVGVVWVLTAVTGKRAAVVIVGSAVLLTALIVWAVSLVSGGGR